MLELLALLLDRGGNVREAGHEPRVSCTALAALSATWCAVLLVLLLLGSPGEAETTVPREHERVVPCGLAWRGKARDALRCGVFPRAGTVTPETMYSKPAHFRRDRAECVGRLGRVPKAPEDHRFAFRSRDGNLPRQDCHPAGDVPF